MEDVVEDEHEVVMDGHLGVDKSRFKEQVDDVGDPKVSHGGDDSTWAMEGNLWTAESLDELMGLKRTEYSEP